MSEYYLDIETTGIEPANDKIITIQFQKLNNVTGKPTGKLSILKEWVSSEKRILKKFIPILLGKSKWDFIPVAQNIRFDFLFLTLRSKKYKIYTGKIDPLQDKVWLDVSTLLIMMNEGTFRGHANVVKYLPWMKGRYVPGWYEDENYDKIIKYVKTEAKTFIKAYQILKHQLTIIRDEHPKIFTEPPRW